MRRVMRYPLVVVLFLAGCASFSPLSERELAGLWESAPPGSVLFAHWGTARLRKFTVWDQDGRPVLQPERDFPGARLPLSPLAINQERVPFLLAWSFPVGHYRVTWIPYYFTGTFFRQRIDLPKGGTSFYVGREQDAVHDRFTARHWGAVVNMHGGDVPLNDFQRNINFSIRCC